MAKVGKRLGAEATGFPEHLDTHVADLIFVKGRDRTPNPEEIRHNALDTATTYIIPNEITCPDALGEARAAFDDLYGLSSIVLNADLTIAFQSDQTGPLPTLYERIFFSVKRILGIKRGSINIKEKIFSNLELKREFLLARMRADLIEAFRTVCKDKADRENFVRELLADAGWQDSLLAHPVHGRPSGVSPPEPAAPALELPSAPPAWWRDRQPGETADNWLRTHYKPYIDAGILTRGFFQRPGQDKAFANALLAWEKAGNLLPADLDLPTKSELLDRQLEQMGGIPMAPGPLPLSSAQVRQGARLYQAARRRLG